MTGDSTTRLLSRSCWNICGKVLCFSSCLSKLRDSSGLFKASARTPWKTITATQLAHILAQRILTAHNSKLFSNFNKEMLDYRQSMLYIHALRPIQFTVVRMRPRLRQVNGRAPDSDHYRCGAAESICPKVSSSTNNSYELQSKHHPKLEESNTKSSRS